MAGGSTTASTAMAVADFYYNTKGSIKQYIVTGCANINSKEGIMKVELMIHNSVF